MYPLRDFQDFLVSDGTFSQDQIIRSLSREPLVEILAYWCKYHRSDYLNKKTNYWYNIYCSGIKLGVSRNKYPAFQIDKIEKYPEFYIPVRDGLLTAWANLRFSIDKVCGQDDVFQLYIGSIKGHDIFIPDFDKVRLARHIPYKMSITIFLNHLKAKAGIFPDKSAEKIYQRIYWLDKAIYKMTN